MPTFSFPIGSILKAITVCTVPGQIAMNQHKFQMTSLTGASNFLSVDFLNSYDNDMSALYPPLLSNGAQYYGTAIYLMNPIGVAPRPDTTSQNQQIGTGGAGLLPTQTSGLISWYTSYLGKQGQGRSYIPFPSPAHSEANGTPTAAYNLGLASLATAIRIDRVITVGPVTATFSPVLYQGGPATPLFITDATARDAWATQRRRGSYGRANNPPF